MKENVITQSIPGGFSVIASAFIIETLENMIPWLIVSFAVIVCDLAFGVRKSLLLGEHVRFSRAIRATMGKMVTYFAFVCMVCMINVASKNQYSIDIYSCLLVCFIEGCSIIGNILKPKGIDVNMIAAIGVFCKKVFSIEKEDVKEIIEKEEQNEITKGTSKL
ncbi:MAG: phage holin family protein [Bacteroides nordii]